MLKSPSAILLNTEFILAKRAKESLNKKELSNSTIRKIPNDQIMGRRKIKSIEGTKSLIGAKSIIE